MTDRLAWNSEQCSLLRRLFCIVRKTADEIAVELSRRYGVEVSRSAISGKLARLGIKREGEPVSSTPRRRVRAKVCQVVLEPLPPVEPGPPLAPVEPALLPPKPCTLVELTNTTCRWPINDGSPFLFCAEPTADFRIGVPYCPDHSEIAYKFRPA